MSVKWYFSISTACRILNSPIIAEAFHSLSINFFTIDDIRVGANLKTKKTDKTKEEYARASYGRIPFNLEEKKLNTLHGKTFPRISSIFWFNGSSESWHVSFDFFFFFVESPTWLQRFLYSYLAIEHATCPDRWKHIQVALSSLFSSRLFSMIFLSRSIKCVWKIEDEFNGENFYKSWIWKCKNEGIK